MFPSLDPRPEPRLGMAWRCLPALLRGLSGADSTPAPRRLPLWVPLKLWSWKGFHGPLVSRGDRGTGTCHSGLLELVGVMKNIVLGQELDSEN